MGYPHGSYDVPVECQVVACCDIYKALTEDRPYRGGMAHEEAMAIMEDMVARDELDGDIVGTIGRMGGSLSVAEGLPGRAEKAPGLVPDAEPQEVVSK